MAKQKLQYINPFGLRLQPELKEKLEAMARKVPHSLNAEIVKRLEESLTARHSLSEYSDGELLDELIRRYGRDAIRVQIDIKKPE